MLGHQMYYHCHKSIIIDPDPVGFVITTSEQEKADNLVSVVLLVETLNEKQLLRF